MGGGCTVVCAGGLEQWGDQQGNGRFLTRDGHD